MREKLCLDCALPITRYQPTIQCAGCKVSLSHQECCVPHYISGKPHLSCCQPSGSGTIAPPTVTTPPTTQTDICTLGTHLSDTDSLSTIDAPTVTPTTATSVFGVLPAASPRTSSSTLSSSAKRKHADTLPASLSPPARKPKTSATTVRSSAESASSDMGDAGDTTPPPWFAAFSNQFNSRMDAQNAKMDAQNEKMDAQNAKMDAHNAKMDAIQESIIKAEEERKKEAEHNKQQMDLLRQQFTLTDELEVLILGLPSVFNGTYDEATRLLYAALGLSTNKVPLFDYRDWSPRQQQQDSGPPLTKAYVIELPTPRSRTNLLSQGPKLKTLRANDIWKVGGPHLVSIRPLYPPPVHKLHAAARRVSKEIKYAQPIIKGLVVCMRKNRNSPAVPIYSMEELEGFRLQKLPRPPQPPPPPPSAPLTNQQPLQDPQTEQSSSQIPEQMQQQ